VTQMSGESQLKIYWGHPVAPRPDEERLIAVEARS
jgi:hypothetical protein